MKNTKNSLKSAKIPSFLPSFSAWGQITAKTNRVYSDVSNNEDVTSMKSSIINIQDILPANDLDDITLDFEVFNHDIGASIPLNQVPPVISPADLLFSSSPKEVKTSVAKATSHEGRPPRAVTPYPKERIITSPSAPFLLWKAISPRISPAPVESSKPGIAEKP